jgi:hypothetical protein
MRGWIRGTQHLRVCGGSRWAGRQRMWWSVSHRGTTSSHCTRTYSSRIPIQFHMTHPPSLSVIPRRARESTRTIHDYDYGYDDDDGRGPPSPLILPLSLPSYHRRAFGPAESGDPHARFGDPNLALKNRAEIEDVYGSPLPNIPLFLMFLQRLDSILFSLGLTLALSAAYASSGLEACLKKTTALAVSAVVTGDGGERA